MFKKKKIKNIAVCSKCGEEIEWIKSDKGKMYAVNLGKKEKDPDYFHSSTCTGLDEPEPVKEEVKEKPSGSEKIVPVSSTIAKSGEVDPSEKPEEVKTEPEEKKEMTIGDVLNNHEARLRELEISVLKILEHFGRVYLEGDKKK